MTLRDDLTASLEATPPTMASIAESCRKAIDNEWRFRRVATLCRDAARFADQSSEKDVRLALEKAARVLLCLPPE